ncbi:hypothetical protein [Halosegnis marinus]|uniref:DUF5658 domain-containing protein n=1 Tax=Halosegnis marinus TaxID=3034023 RepID=A0ABD5ZQ18_9EURY|nr:hypothetical protein [Halosegnis sp. DT85]
MTSSELRLREAGSSGREFTRLWLVALATYGVGDVVTTVALTRFVPRLSEGNLLLAALLNSHGNLGLIGLKLAVFAGCLAISLYGARTADRFVYYLPPALLAVVGGFTTAYNLRLLFG